MNAFETILNDNGCLWPDIKKEEIDEVDVYLYLCEWHANDVYNDFDDTIIEWIQQEVRDSEMWVHQEYLSRFEDKKISHYIFEYFDEYGYTEFNTVEYLEQCVLAVGFEKMLKDSYFDEWKPKLEKALGKRFDKLKALWRKKKAMEILKKTDVFIMTDEIGKYL